MASMKYRVKGLLDWHLKSSGQLRGLALSEISLEMELFRLISRHKSLTFILRCINTGKGIKLKLYVLPIVYSYSFVRNMGNQNLVCFLRRV